MLNPRLLAISGSHKEWALSVEDGPVVLGRDPSNSLPLGDPAVSRKHCSISQVSGGIFEIADLDSHNGTFVNGTRVERETLRHGARIRIGSSEFIFLTDPDDDALLSSLAAIRGAGVTSKTTSLNPSGLPVDASGIGRMARDLTALFKIANIINSTLDSRDLQLKLLALICEVVPATQAAIVLQSSDGEVSPPCIWNREGMAEKELVIREDLVRQAIWEHSAITATESDQAMSSDHVMCVPLVAAAKILGVIYLSSPAFEQAFGEAELFFVTAVSRIAAVTLENVSKLDALRVENQRLRAEIGDHATLIGESRPMRRVSEFIGRVAQGDSTVLIRGESGTGKELVARAIHTNSSRSDNPFVAINCAAIPEALLESELFGHEKGAFTGAVATKKGKFEAAEDGTLFLDEIGEMSPLLQAKLLRVLQQREFERLGGNRLLSLNARVVAATNKNLEQAIKAREFRQDLYYRLNVVSVTLPSLREHGDDIPLLALYFANKYAVRCKRVFKGIAAEARTLLMQYSWPGNVRELENAIEHAIVMGLTDEILIEDLPEALLEEASSHLTAARYHNTLHHAKKQLVLAALDEADGRPVEAARILGIHPKYLHRLIRNLALKTDVKRRGLRAGKSVSGG